MRMGGLSALAVRAADINQHARLREWPKGFEANSRFLVFVRLDRACKPGRAMCYRTRVELGETGPKPPRRHEGVRDTGRQAGPTARHEETNAGCRGGCGARPCGRCRVFLERLVVAEGCGAGVRVATSARCRVAVATAVKKSVPVRLEALGTVTTIASVAIKPRVDSEIIAVQFEDGARVKQGDVLFILDSRVDRERRSSRSRPSSPAPRRSSSRRQRDVARYTELVAKNATTVVTLNNAKTQVNVSARARRVQQGDARRPEGPARLLHDPRADLRPHQHGERQGRQLRAPGRPRRRSRPSTRSRRSMSPSRCRSAACRTCARRSRPRPRRSRRSFPAATRARPARSR